MSWAPSFVGSFSTSNIGGVIAQDRSFATPVAVGDRLLGTVTFNSVDSASDAVTSITDTQSNTWTRIVRTTDQLGRRIEHWESIATQDGIFTVTFHFNQSVKSTSVLVAAWTGMPSPVVIALDTNRQTSNTGTHFSAPSGEINTSRASVIVCGGVLTGSAGTITDPTGFTQLSSLGTSARMFWRIASSGESAQRGQWGTSNSRQSSNAIFAWAEATVGGVSPLPRLRRMHAGVYRGMFRGVN